MVLADKKIQKEKIDVYKIRKILLIVFIVVILLLVIYILIAGKIGVKDRLTQKQEKTLNYNKEIGLLESKLLIEYPVSGVSASDNKLSWINGDSLEWYDLISNKLTRTNYPSDDSTNIAVRTININSKGSIGLIVRNLERKRNQVLVYSLDKNRVMNALNSSVNNLIFDYTSNQLLADIQSRLHPLTIAKLDIAKKTAQTVSNTSLTNASIIGIFKENAYIYTNNQIIEYDTKDKTQKIFIDNVQKVVSPLVANNIVYIENNKTKIYSLQSNTSQILFEDPFISYNHQGKIVLFSLGNLSEISYMKVNINDLSSQLVAKYTIDSKPNINFIYLDEDNKRIIYQMDDFLYNYKYSR